MQMYTAIVKEYGTIFIEGTDIINARENIIKRLGISDNEIIDIWEYTLKQ